MCEKIIPNKVDVVVVGAGVAGTAAAILLQKAGLSTLLIDQHTDIKDYKQLCTHFIQPFANSIFYELGVPQLLDANHSIETKAVFHVPGGIIDTLGGYGDLPMTSHAHNLERRIMDPVLRQQAKDLGVNLLLGTRLKDLKVIKDGFELRFKIMGHSKCVTAQFVVAADGRNSRLAKLLEAETTTLPNDRAAFFGYCANIPAPEKNRSIFVLKNSEMSFLYPLIGGRTLLSVYIKPTRADEWRERKLLWPSLLAQFQAHLPDIDFSHAKPETLVVGYKRYENQIRPPIVKGVAFIGDASISVDPMSGVGCSFGLKSAQLLANAIINNLNKKSTALDIYEASHSNFFLPHITGIAADSLITKSDKTVAETYQTILQDEKLKKRYLDLTARLISPEQFQKSFLMSAAKSAARNKNIVA
jgi:flavin-dependent dehydrogenase